MTDVLKKFSVSVTNIIDLIDNLASGKKKDSEFVCYVCDRKFMRKIDTEWDYLAFNSKMEDESIGIVWTCGDLCKTTYMLQKKC